MEHVEIRVDKLKGRSLFAVKDFKKGDILFEETPLVCSQFEWNALYKYLACDHCMKSLEKAEDMSRRLAANPSLVLPFPQCCKVKKEEHTVCPHCKVLYCSDGCRDSAWHLYHKVLCQGASLADPNHPTEKLKDAWRNMHYPPETSSIMLIARMIALVKQSDKKDQILSKFAEFCKSTVNEEEHIAHKLLGKEFQEQLEILRSLVCEAFYDEHVQQWFTPEGFRSLFALIGTNGQGVGTSSLSVWVHNCDALELSDEERQTLDAFIDQLYVDIEKESGTFLNCEGSGLYTFQSACNHSCQPNAEVTFPHNNFTLQMVAVQNIKAGEEICISYLDECDRERSRHSRQKALRENYLFNCNCSLCQSQIDDPDVTSEEEEEEEEEEEDEQMQEDS